jgi:hypothetical protein
MTKPMIRIHNAETDEVVDVEMTDAQYAQYQKDQADNEALKAEIAAKATAREALLKRLGITAEEAAILLG